MDGKNVLVTGANGHVGYALIKLLLETKPSGIESGQTFCGDTTESSPKPSPSAS